MSYGAGEIKRQKTRPVRSARVTRSRLRGRAPVRDQSVIGKIKETVANGADRRRIHMYIFAASDSERKRKREGARKRDRERNKESEREGERERF